MTTFQSPSRRQVIRSLAAGSLLMPGILAELLAGENRRVSHTANDGLGADPLAARAAHFAPRAQRVIFLFSTGGVSHMDTFDHKSRLFQADGR